MFLVVLNLQSPLAATGLSGMGVELNYASFPVTTSTWKVLVPNTPLTTSSVQIFDSSGAVIQLGIADASAPANSEVMQLLIPPGGTPADIQIPAGSRISIKAFSSTVNTGQDILDVLF